MSIVDAFRNYRALNGEQVELLRTKQIRGSRTPAEWLAFLGGAAAYDASADRLRSVAGWGIAVGFLAGFVGGIVLQSLIVLIAFFVICALSVILFIRLKRQDLPNTMRLCVLPLVALLREEMEADAPLVLRCDLTGGMRQEKRTDAHQLPQGRYLRGEETFYRDGWFEGEGTLADESNVAWSVVDMIRQREITKRSSSGKIKSKRKFKVRRVIDVRVAMKQDAYALADLHAAGGRGHDRVAVKAGEKRNVMKLRRILIETRPDAPLDPKHIIDLLAEAYRRVTLNKTEE
jgi:hypothetical protein